MGRTPAGPGGAAKTRPPNNRPPRTGPRRPGVGAGTAPNPTPKRACRRRQAGTARNGPAPAATAGHPAVPGWAGTAPAKPGRVRRQPAVPQAPPAPRLAGPRLAGPAPAPSRPGAGPPDRPAGGPAAQRASLRNRNLILTTGAPTSTSPLAARRPDPRRSSRSRIRERPTRWARAAGPAGGPRYGKRQRNGPPGPTGPPRLAAPGRAGRRGRAAGPGGAAAAGSW